jgi:hypothetical protein
MHRSGTSLVTELLGELGVFTGWLQETNGEAWLFHRLNRWLFAQAGAVWDCPEGVDDLLDDPDLRALCAASLRRVLDSPRAVTYAGPRRYLTAWRDGRLGEPWAFKDPRNTFTWPMWHRLYPRARFVHVLRHGVDVAASLRARRRERVRDRWPLFERVRRWIPVLPPATATVSSRVRSLEAGLELWERYAHRGREHLADAEEGCKVRFEQLVREPEDTLWALADALEIEVEPGAVERASRRVDPERALAHRGDPSLQRLANQQRSRLRAFGYETK